MTSDRQPSSAFVWVWLPGETEPVVAGRLDQGGSALTFTYGRSYRERKEAIPLYLPELPLVAGPIRSLVGDVAGCIADSGPDSWGQRVILNRRLQGGSVDTADLRLLDYLLESGSDRIGALDFQHSATDYEPRRVESATLDELASSAAKVDAGDLLSPALDAALLHGSSIGGARPKALLDDGGRKLIAKFSSSTDAYPIVKGEFIAMELARRVGLSVAPVELTTALGKDVLLIDRFDRSPDGARRMMVSALTVLGLDEPAARYASYAALATEVGARFTDPKATRRELFARMVFNILVGNSDDHARNHSAFWDGEYLALTPAYDLAPQPRAGGETSQAMAIGDDGYRMSQVAGCVERAASFGLADSDAREIVARQIELIEAEWEDVCALAGLTEVERAYFLGRQFLNPYSLEGF